MRKTSMRPILFLIVCFLSLSVSSFAQATETFDIATFQPPAGWKKQTAEASVQFSSEDSASGSFCLITLFKTVPGPGDSKQNFAAAWETVVKQTVPVTNPP